MKKYIVLLSILLTSCATYQFHVVRAIQEKASNESPNSDCHFSKVKVFKKSADNSFIEVKLNENNKQARILKNDIVKTNACEITKFYKLIDIQPSYVLFTKFKFKEVSKESD